MVIFDYFRRLPYWLQSQIIIVVVAALIGVWLKFDWTIALFALGGVLVIAVILGIFFWLIRRGRQKQAEAFGGEITQQNSLTPRGISDPAKQARLDDLRRNFNTGLTRFKAVGKDLYKLPWYVIVGEPGAGKTEAIRHSGVGFPPGMQDELQGVGGTINMNWWFTNQAVILDTAGRLLFEEVEPGASNEWREFLTLLKKYRPSCPVNGLFLALPADSLIREEPAEIERKAGRIARQLELIQRQFDLRFPVFVIITKCDLLNGFREFFDGLDDPSAKNQMIGWSNPDPLDAPFRTELIDAHIETSLARLRRRRLALLGDPVAQAGAQARRIDDVDRLYALPQSLSLVAPRLRRYLEIIFTANEWSAKPLFLRGIYFTSSLREGSALDQELAESLGVSVDQLPEGRAWEREETFFLRDVFLEKGFRERGLVTRASNTRKLLRMRQAILFGTGFAAVALLALFSFLAQRALEHSVARQGGYWLRAADGWQPENRWQPAAVPTDKGGGAKAAFAGDKAVGPGERPNTRLLFHGGGDSLTQFEADLRELASLPLEVSWIFKPLASFGVGIDRDRRRAQRVVFEDSVVKPLLDAARDQMTAGPAATAAEEDTALVALLHFEGAVLKKTPINSDDGEEWNEKFLRPLLPFTVGKTPGDDTRPLAAVAAWTYSQDGSRDAWAPEWLSGGNTLPANKAIAAGIARLTTRAETAIKGQGAEMGQLTQLADLVKQYRDRENELYKTILSTRPVEQIDKQFFLVSGLRDELADPQGSLKTAKDGLDRKLAELAAVNPAVFGKDFLLHTGYERTAHEVSTCLAQIKALLAECEPFLPAPASGSSGSSNSSERVLDRMTGQQREAAEAAMGAMKHIETTHNALFVSAAEKLRALIPPLEAALPHGGSTESIGQEWLDLDRDYLEPYTDGRRLYVVRWDQYLAADHVGPGGRNYAANQQLIGSDWKALQDIFAKTAAMRWEVDHYQRGLKERYAGIVNYILLRVERFHGNEFPLAYLAQVKARIKGLGKFPLLHTIPNDPNVLGVADLANAGKTARAIAADLKSPVLNLPAVRNESTTALRAYAAKLGPWQQVAEALTTPGGELSNVTITLLAGSTQRNMVTAYSSTLEAYPSIELRNGPREHGATTDGRRRSDPAGDQVLGQFPSGATFHFHFYPVDGAMVDLDCGRPYTAIRLIHGFFGTGRFENGAYMVPVSPDTQRQLWIKLQFPKPLPTLETWPTKDSLEIGD